MSGTTRHGIFSSFAQGPSVQAHYGMGMGGGMGRGIRMGMARGMRRGMGMGGGFSPAAPPPSHIPGSSQDELRALKEQSNQLKEQLDNITDRIEKMKAKK